MGITVSSFIDVYDANPPYKNLIFKDYALCLGHYILQCVNLRPIVEYIRSYVVFQIKSVWGII